MEEPLPPLGFLIARGDLAVEMGFGQGVDHDGHVQPVGLGNGYAIRPQQMDKHGVIRLAHAANAVIVPFSVSAEKAWVFNSWDKFLLPKPFSKVFLRFGKMIKFDRVKDKEIFEKQRMQLEEIMLPTLRV